MTRHRTTGPADSLIAAQPAAHVEVFDGTRWLRACPYDALTPGRGVVVLAPDGAQVALFRDRAGTLYAVDNRDPFSGAQVMARGIVGSRGGAPTVASPMYKQVFDLRDGRCLDEPTAPDGTPATLRTWPVRRGPATPVPDSAADHATGRADRTDPVFSHSVPAGVREP